MSHSDSLAAALRHATREAHRTLDHHPLLAALVRPDLDVTAYAAALAALHGAHASIEARVADFIPAADFPPRLPELVSDLDALGISTPACLATPPEPGDMPSVIGMLYVIEGSNLGAMVIARQLERSLPPRTPRRFFTASGGHARWEKFWQFATAHSASESNALAVQAALATFGFYRQHLDHCARVA